MVKKGVETVATTDVVGQSIDALEKVSSVITSNLSFDEVNKEPVQSKANVVVHYQYEKPEKPFSVVFEEVGGTAHLQSLENLSFKCIMKTQQMYLKLNSDQRETVDVNNTKIQDEFKHEIQGENLIAPPTLDIITKNIVDSIEDTITQYKSTREQLRDINYIKQIIGEFSFQNEQSIDQTIGDVLKLIYKIEEECILTLSKLSTLSILQLLRIGEFLALISEGKADKVQADKFLEFCHQLCILCAYFDQEITAISTLYIDHLQQIIECLTVGLKDKENLENYQKWIQGSTLYVSSVRKNIYIYVGNTISSLEEAKKSILNIAKLVVISEYETQQMK